MKTLLLAIGVFYSSIAIGQIANGSTAPNFTATDINGSTYDLYADYLDQGKAVILDVSATWCGPCWNYHHSHALANLYKVYGDAGSGELGIFLVEGDGNTSLADLQGTGTNTIGDWVTGTDYPIIDDVNIASDYQISYFPTIFGICPDTANGNHTVYLAGQLNASDMIAWLSSNCGSTLNGIQNNASITEAAVQKICLGEFTPQVSIGNHSGNNLSSLVLELKENNNIIETKNWNGNLNPFEEATVSFNTLTGVTNNTTYNVNISLPNGQTDMYPDYNEGSFDSELAAISSSNNINIKIVTDQYPGETSWKLTDENGNILAAAGPYQGNGTSPGGADADTEFNYPVVLPNSVSCYELVVEDSYGDGLQATNGNSGYWVNDGNTDIINSGIRPDFGTLSEEPLQYEGGSSVEENTEGRFSIYPNPTKDLLTITTKERTQLLLTNTLGETLTNKTLHPGSTQIDLTGLSKGVYYVHFQSEFSRQTQKIILQN
jgi:thiol-disulfide isomerase/thioredoxin